MSITQTEIRRGAYYDSVVLMQLQTNLADLPGISYVGVMMGTAANKDMLSQSNLLTVDAQAAQPDDLIIAVQSEDESAAQNALSQIDTFLTRRRSLAIQGDYLPKSLEAAAHMQPEANWVLISVPGRYAAEVARDALRLDKHVFLYSDNVSLEEEVSLKEQAAGQGLLVMGPDCGTAIVNGVGLGFANQVRRGSIGLVGASGTGLQHVTARIHQLGGGITHALGTGGRDLSAAVGAITAHQCLYLLRRDPETAAIVLISKPPAPEVAQDLLQAARATGKPVVINFIGYTPEQATGDGLHFAASLDEAADLAMMLLEAVPPDGSPIAAPEPATGDGPTYLRGLFSGGTLAYEAQILLQAYLPRIYANVPLNKEAALENPLVSREHTIVDLGEDEFTVGRLHPMLDNTLRLQRLAQEATDPTVALILLDVVLGYGAHPNPAAELAPAIAQAITQAQAAGRSLEIVTLVVGTDEDPQDMSTQIEQLQQAGTRVETDLRAATRAIGQKLQTLNRHTKQPPVSLTTLTQSLAAINVGLESFTASLSAQQTPVIHVDWRPPAGGNEKLMAILARMKGAA